MLNAIAIDDERRLHLQLLLTKSIHSKRFWHDGKHVQKIRSTSSFSFSTSGFNVT